MDNYKIDLPGQPKKYFKIGEQPDENKFDVVGELLRGNRGFNGALLRERRGRRYFYQFKHGKVEELNQRQVAVAFAAMAGHELDEVYLSTRQAAALAGVTAQTVSNWRKSGVLIPVNTKRKGNYHFARKDVVDAMETMKRRRGIRCTNGEYLKNGKRNGKKY